MAIAAPGRCEAVTPTSERAFDALVQTAAARYRPAGRAAYHFARGKLARDPVFAALLRQRLIPDGARLVDLGCGQGVLLALLAATEDEMLRARWPCEAVSWPCGVRAQGVDLRTRAIAAARCALAGWAQVTVGDVRDYALPTSDVVVILDVLHYIDHPAQRRLLARVHAALVPGGQLLLRVGDAAQGVRYGLTLAGDWLVTLARGHWQRRFFCRRAADWCMLLEELGFAVQVQPMSAGTPFANVLLVAQRI